MAKELFYFSLPAPDMGKSKTFYGSVFGWKVGGGSQGGHVDSTTTPCGLEAQGTTTSVYLATMDLELSIKQVQENGGKVERIENFSVGPCAFCTDNQGTRYALQEPSDELRHHGKNPPKGNKHGDLFFFSLPVMDKDKAIEFYGKVMGWEFGNDEGDQGGLGVTNLSGPDGGLGCGRSGHDASFWIRVDSVQETCDRIKAAGGTAGEVYDGPEGTCSECIDDQGIKFGIIKPTQGD